MKTMYALIVILLLLTATVVKAAPNDQKLVGENLLTPLPEGFKVGSHASDNTIEMTEMVPQSETVDDWSMMVTVQIFHTMPNYSPDMFATQMKQKWVAACTGGDAQKIRTGEENGYPFAFWIFTCPLNTQTGKPENMWLKAIGGQDALYAVQYAYRKELSNELITPAAQYLKQVSVCDTRRTDRVCPAGMQ